MCLYNLKFGKLVLASVLLQRPMHVASLMWFSRLCINTSTEKHLSSESNISIVGQLCLSGSSLHGD